MFAYCNNNAVNSSDSLGARPVSTLERFGDKKIPVPPKRSSQKNKQNNKPGKQNKKNGSTPKGKINHHINAVREAEHRVQQQQNALIRDAATAVWNAYERGYNNQQEYQHHHAAAMIDGFNYLYSKPEETVDMIGASIGMSLSVRTLVVVCLAPNPAAAAVAGAVGTVVWAGYGVYRGIKGLIPDSSQ